MKHYILNLTIRGTEAPEPDLIHRHRLFLTQGFHANLFLILGPKSDGSGTLAVARSESRAVLTRFLVQDPLWAAGCLDVEILEFDPVHFPELLRGWVDPMRARVPEYLLGLGLDSTAAS